MQLEHKQIAMTFLYRDGKYEDKETPCWIIGFFGDEADTLVELIDGTICWVSPTKTRFWVNPGQEWIDLAYGKE